MVILIFVLSFRQKLILLHGKSLKKICASEDFNGTYILNYLFVFFLLQKATVSQLIVCREIKCEHNSKYDKNST